MLTGRRDGLNHHGGRRAAIHVFVCAGKGVDADLRQHDEIAPPMCHFLRRLILQVALQCPGLNFIDLVEEPSF